MTLHPTIRNLLDRRAADIAKDIEHTIACEMAVSGELIRTRDVLRTLREEEQAINDARRLLARISLEQEATE